ncbi:MAG: PepSY domain-containing protein [candidate division KSB1 bacterium]|nr:PepSY domain-containing protein [candidate division KSB1 bacterium]MDZ7273770.1 PepSY domain-containing protein [candidate division KSB1 bacterium]MDZ7285926.1 PepSY domain-containing protein [candidate division KSB1 bacterium]MDZ7298958.1 PepSY domain-containing protein [candidate division KSB1 bacterium]MDZ7308603.1 PepSY domain-containing protein [candidate division KSB1 bacterium]
MRNITLLVHPLAIGLLAVLLQACEKPRQDAGAAGTVDSLQTTSPAPQPAAAAADSTEKLSRAQIEEIAREEMPGALIIAEAIDREDSVLVYEVDVKNERGIFQLVINAVTGAVLEVEDKTADYEAEGKALPAEIPDLAARDAAEQAALASIPGEVVKWKVRDKGQGTYYSFTIRGADGGTQKVKVKAGSNEVQKSDD